MRAQILLHAAFEGPGRIRDHLADLGYDIATTRLFAGEPPPDPESVDFLVVMGGPMSAVDDERHPWLAHEAAFIGRMIEAGKTVLGICLGAQLIARALGGRVFANPEKEIGWFPIAPASGLPQDAFAFPAGLEVFHWHGETFSLPPGALHLAASAACRNQAFQIGPRVMGLQFHIEVRPADVRAMIENGEADLAAPGPYVQPAAEILARPPAVYAAIDDVLGRLMAYLDAGAKQGRAG